MLPIEISTDSQAPIMPFDGRFVPHNLGLQKPIDALYRPLWDLLPGVSAAMEDKLKTDAHIAYVIYQDFDKKQLAALFGNNPDEYEKARDTEMRIKNTISRLQGGIEDAKHALEGDKTLTAIAAKLQTGDYETFAGEHTPTMDEWVLHRVAQFNGDIAIGSDVDKSLTQHADYLQYIPGSVQAENYMAHSDHGRETFPLMFARYWREALTTSMADNFYLIGSHVPLREGVPEFFGLTEQAEIPVSITSANFRPFVDGVMNHLPIVNNIYTTTAVEVDDITATDKSTVVRRLARNLSDRAFFYIGDGESDLPAMDEEARQVVACYFALEGSIFAKQLEAEGLPYYTYRDFRDITATLQRLGLLPNHSI